MRRAAHRLSKLTTKSATCASFALEALEGRRLLAANIIIGTVFDDRNGNALKEEGEPGLAGQFVYLDANLNGVFDSTERNTLTEADGSYSFRALDPGTYRVRHNPPTGRRLTSPGRIFYDIAIPRTDGLVPKDFGNSTMNVIRGTIFNDLNGDGQKQTTEAPLAGWRVFLDKNGDGIYQAGLEKTRLTNSLGEYRFGDLPTGTYFVRIVQQKGWRVVNPANSMFRVTVGSGQSFSNRNFAESEEKIG